MTRIGTVRLLSAVALLVASLVLAAGRPADARFGDRMRPATRPATRPSDPKLPTLFIIGDSTVNNHTRGYMGWGDPIADRFNLKKINVENRARGGRSSRTFFRDGLWAQVMADMKQGDFVMMQFGHNDGIPLSDPRNRATLHGTGEETRDIPDPKTGATETVHTFGWYLRRYIDDTKTRGATAIVLSPVPRNNWNSDGTIARSDDYTQWAAEVARAEGVPFLDLNKIVADRYDAAGRPFVSHSYFGRADRTHTTPLGAIVNAACVVQGLEQLPDCPLRDFVKHRRVATAPATESAPTTAAATTTAATDKSN
jgi:lysophospholipase L1-like esterase